MLKRNRVKVLLKFILDWRDVKAGEICKVEIGLARLLIKKGVAIQLSINDTPERH